MNPIIRAMFQTLYLFSGSRESYRDWLSQNPVPTSFISGLCPWAKDAPLPLRNEILVAQLTTKPVLQTIPLNEIRTGYKQSISNTHTMGVRFISYKMARSVTRVPKIVVIHDPLDSSHYFAIAGAESLTILKSMVPEDCYIEVLTYL
jgi:hypothetical protein